VCMRQHALSIRRVTSRKDTSFKLHEDEGRGEEGFAPTRKPSRRPVAVSPSTFRQGEEAMPPAIVGKAQTTRLPARTGGFALAEMASRICFQREEMRGVVLKSRPENAAPGMRNARSEAADAAAQRCFPPTRHLIASVHHATLPTSRRVTPVSP